MKQELTEDTAGRPNVNGSCLSERAEKKFGRPVPQRDDLWRHLSVGNAEFARKAKVGYFYAAPMGY